MAVNQELPSHPDANRPLLQLTEFYTFQPTSIAHTFRQIISENTNVSASTNIIQSLQDLSFVRNVAVKEEEPGTLESVQMCHSYFDRISVTRANKTARENKK